MAEEGARGDGGGRAVTILVVDDEAEVRDLAVFVLSDLGYHVIPAADGEAALRVLEQADRVDLLFTDVVMPGGIDGVELASLARQRNPTLRVLFTSGYHPREEIAADRLVKKPWRVDQLRERIERALSP